MTDNGKTEPFADVMQGTNGTPGSRYEKITANLCGFISGGFEVNVSASRGSNQGGTLEVQQDMTFRGRGPTITAAIGSIRQDVVSLEDWLTIQQRHQLLRDLEYDALDAVAGTDWAEPDTRDEEIASLRRVVDELTKTLEEFTKA